MHVCKMQIAFYVVHPSACDNREIHHLQIILLFLFRIFQVFDINRIAIDYALKQISYVSYTGESAKFIIFYFILSRLISFDSFLYS